MLKKIFKKNVSKKKKINDFEKFIPYKHPFLFFDKIKFFKNSYSVVSKKKISSHEGYLNSHFPGQLMFPGVLIIESILQSCCYLINKSAYQNSNFKFPRSKLCYVTKIENSKFKKIVFLNEKIVITVNIIKTFLSKFAKISGLVFSKNFLICQSCMIVYSKNIKYLCKF